MVPETHPMRPLIVSALLVLAAATPAAAGKVKVWQAHAPADYERATLRGAVVSSEGAVRLSRRLKPLPGLEAEHVWDVTEDRAGNLYAATGDDGKVYRITPDGDVSVAYAGPDSQVLCLAVGGDGAVYAGTGPGGRVVRIDREGRSRVLFAGAENYVWALAFADDGKTLYAGTGPKGRVYTIDADGRSEVFFQSRQDHILSLAATADGSLYAGTDKDGLVYRIDRAGKASVLFQAPQSEVRTLLATAEGLYAGTSAPARKRSGTARSSDSVSLIPTVPKGTTAIQPASHRTSDLTPLGTGKDSGKDGDSEHDASAPAPAAPAAGDNSVYRIAADGAAREVFRDRKLVLGLDRRAGRLFVGTGLDGRLFEVEEATRERTEIARLDHGLVHKLFRRRDGSVVVAAGDPGRLYRLQDKFAARGTVISDVLDAKLTSRWGALRWYAELPPCTHLSVAVRSGNVAEPDDTWSDWSPEQTDAQAATAPAPPARFLQYRVTLTSDDPAVTPALHRLSVRYATANQAPELTSVTVPDPEAATTKEPKKLRLKWSATDPNEDELSYSVYARKDGWREWVLLEEGLSKPEWEWDTTTTPAGVYRVKVVASDRPDNPDGEALSAERVSGPVVVAHDAPEVALRVASVEGDRAVIEAEASDPLSRIAAASYAINGRKWVNVFPKDGLFDDRRESFRFTTEALPPGTYVLLLRVRDAAGNTGTADVVFKVKEGAAK